MNNNFAPRTVRRFLTAAAVVAVSAGTVLSAGVAQAATTAPPAVSPVTARLMLACRFTASDRTVLCYSNTPKPTGFASWAILRGDGTRKDAIRFDLDHVILTPDFQAIADNGFGPVTGSSFRTVVDPSERVLLNPPSETGLLNPPSDRTAHVNQYYLIALDVAGRSIAQSPVVSVQIPAA